MALCLVALPVLAVLGIFSVKYRKLTKDALNCLFKTATLKKCESDLDERIKSGITGNMLRYSPKTAKFVYKNYKILSWVFILLLLWSSYEASVGAYNYINYGNCNGPESTEFCILDPTGKYTGTSELELDLFNIEPPEVALDDPIIGGEAELTAIEFGCYVCPYTKKAEKTTQELLEKHKGKINIQFKAVEIPGHKNSLNTAMASLCAHEQDKYQEYHERIFQTQIQTEEDIHEIAESAGLNMSKYRECYDTRKYESQVEKNTNEGIKSGIQGTPTFFIEDKMIAGPKPLKTFEKIMNELE
jgi:hypothetical protein